MPLKTKEQREQNAAAMKERLADPIEPVEAAADHIAETPESLALIRDAQRTLGRFDKAVKKWNRRHPALPISKIELTDRGVRYEVALKDAPAGS